MSKRNYTTRSFVLFAALLITATPLYAADLPTMYVGSPKTFLSVFPLSVCRFTTPVDVVAAYGDPQMKIEGAGENKEIWTYYKKSTVYTFYFVNSKVHDVTSTYTGSRWINSTFSARELQNVERRP